MAPKSRDFDNSAYRQCRSPNRRQKQPKQRDEYTEDASHQLAESRSLHRLRVVRFHAELASCDQETDAHAGCWRNAQNEAGFELQQIVQLPNQQVAFRAPLTAPARRDSYLHTGEYDTTLPASMVRRLWCIMTGPSPTSMQAIWDARLNHGYGSLDDYKDWILDWRPDPKVTYPRLFFTVDDVKRARQYADSNPYEEELLAMPYFSDDPAVAQQLVEKAAKCGRYYARHLMFRGGYMSLPWISGFHQSNYALRVTIPTEQTLSNKNLDPALRDKMRAVLAA